LESFDTPRLHAERLAHAHRDELGRLYHDPRVLEMLTGYSFALADRVIRDRIDLAHEHWERHGFGLWAFRDRPSGRFVGRGGLCRFELDQLTGIELVYAVVPDFWGQGYATEIAAASLAVGFGRLDVSEVESWVLASNAASRQVLEKLGFRPGRDHVFGGLSFLGFRLQFRDQRDVAYPAGCSYCRGTKLSHEEYNASVPSLCSQHPRGEAGP
jgi:RimJ/RimL family protein N-acetyltransferase